MSLSHQQQRQLRLIRSGLRRSDPQLCGMFGVFGRLCAGEDIPAWEQEVSGRSRLRRAAALIPAVLAAIRVLLGRAVAVAVTGWRGRGRTPAAKRGRTRPGREAEL
jgi:Protein of unknown function (DUF3040)